LSNKNYTVNCSCEVPLLLHSYLHHLPCSAFIYFLSLRIAPHSHTARTLKTRMYWLTKERVTIWASLRTEQLTILYCWKLINRDEFLIHHLRLLYFHFNSNTT
jgi:hypothetical protein